jgi:hypothetical protein
MVMKSFKTLVLTSGVLGLLLIPGIASADETYVQDPNPNVQHPVGAGQPSETLPPPRSDYDPQPPVAAPTVPETGVTQQAGVGGTQAYGRAGVLELGGSTGFERATGYTRFNFSPSVGLFLLDNVELSALLGINYLNAEEGSATLMSALIEPSVHLPFSQTFFGFIGLGMGVNYAERVGTGFALAPRLGTNFLVGRSGILTPAFQVTYSTTEAIPTSQGTLLAVALSYGFNIGYTVMW